MNFLSSQLNAADRAIVNESNAQKLDTSLAFMLTPSIDPATNVATVNLGAPTAGTWPVDALWVDAARAIWRCTLAGTPGTWLQVAAAAVSVDPAGPPNDYTIARIAEHLKLYYWSGSAWTTV